MPKRGRRRVALDEPATAENGSRCDWVRWGLLVCVAVGATGLAVAVLRGGEVGYVSLQMRQVVNQAVQGWGVGTADQAAQTLASAEPTQATSTASPGPKSPQAAPVQVTTVLPKAVPEVTTPLPRLSEEAKLAATVMPTTKPDAATAQATTASSSASELVATTAPSLPKAENPTARAQAKEKCKKLAFLRIQKTASTTFGQDIMSAMCSAQKQKCNVGGWKTCARNMPKCNLPTSYYHLDFRFAYKLLHGEPAGRACVMTFLRDPVERTMSEFFMLREKHRQFLSFDQWDVHEDDLGPLDTILNIKDVSDSFQQYLHYPGNPSRNRQSLYILGFQRVLCKSKRCGGDACVCDEDASATPSKAYSWDSDSQQLLEQAKKNLQQLDAFGITDCFDVSVEVMAPLLGWDVKAAVKIAKSSHALHVWKHTMEKASKIRPGSSASSNSSSSRRLLHQLRGLEARQTPPLPASSDAGGRASTSASRRLSFNGPGSNFWREFVTPEVRKEILAVNKVDAELVRFARTLFFERYGKECEDKA